MNCIGVACGMDTQEPTATGYRADTQDSWTARMERYRVTKPLYAEGRLRSFLLQRPHDFDDNIPESWAIDLQTKWNLPMP